MIQKGYFGWENVTVIESILISAYLAQPPFTHVLQIGVTITPEKEFFKLLFGVKITPQKVTPLSPTRGVIITPWTLLWRYISSFLLFSLLKREVKLSTFLGDNRGRKDEIKGLTNGWVDQYQSLAQRLLDIAVIVSLKDHWHLPK